jgi:surfeit locus 1 family protein
MSDPAPKPPVLTKLEIIGSIVILLLAVVFSRLSLWQVHRMNERRTMNESIALRLDAPPIQGFAGLTDTTGALYRRIQIRGRFDNEHSIVLPGRSLMGSPGVHLVTPVILPTGTAVLVNRGWLPSADAATVDLAAHRAAPADSIVGLVLPFLNRGQSVSAKADSTPRAGEFRVVWYAIDEAALRAQFPYALAPFIVQVLPGGDAKTTIPRPLDPPALDEGPHLSYALQWFSFAVIAIVGWITFVLRNRSARGAGPRIVHGPPHPPRL